MKKFFYLLLALPLGIFMSCSDDNDLPDVGLNIQLDGCVEQGDTLYVAQGDTLTVESITLVNNTDKKGMLGVTNYYFDRLFVGSTMLQPYTFSIDSGTLPVGNHLLGIQTSIAVVDYPLCYGFAEYIVKIVPTKEDLPDGGTVPAPDPQRVRISEGK